MYLLERSISEILTVEFYLILIIMVSLYKMIIINILYNKLAYTLKDKIKPKIKCWNIII